MIEEKIKNLIKERYDSVKWFAKKIGVPYTTLDTMLKRGLLNSNVQNVMKVCNELEIDIDELKNGKIVPKDVKEQIITDDSFDVGLTLKEIVNKRKLTCKDFMDEMNDLIDKHLDINDIEKNEITNYLEYMYKRFNNNDNDNNKDY